MQRYFILILMIVPVLFPGVVFAQFTVEGRVTDKLSGEPIESVRVYQPESGKMILTDSSGTYRIKVQSASDDKLEFSALGYHSAVVRLTLDKALDRVSYNIALEPSVLEVPEVTVTAVNRILPQHSAYSFSALTGEQIQHSGALTLTQALTLMPGISQITTGPAISKPVIRGLSGNRIVTIYQGVHFDNQQWQEEHGLGLSDIGIDHIEVIRGPASLLYGSEAMGGVISIVDEKPAPINITMSDLNMRFSSNTYGLYSEYGIKASDESHSWRIRAGLESHADYTDGTNYRIPDTRFNGGTIKAGMTWRRQKRVTMLDYTGSLYQFGYLTEDNRDKITTDKRQSRSMFGPHHSVNFNLISLRNTWFLQNSVLKLTTGLHLNNRQEQENGNRIALNMLLNTLSYDLRWVKSISKTNELSIGSQGSAQSNTNLGSRVIIPDAFLAESALFGYLKHTRNKLDVEAGARLDYRLTRTFGIDPPVDLPLYKMPALSRSYLTPNGSLGASYEIIKHLRVKGNVATGYRVPNLAELSSSGIHEGTYRYELGDPNMKQEQNLSLDAGIHYESRNISFQLSAFRNFIRNFIYLSGTADTVPFIGLPLYTFRQADAILTGGELSLDYRPRFANWLDLTCRYAHIDARRNNGNYLPFIPQNRINSGLRFSLDRWKNLQDAFIGFEFEHAFAQDHPGNFESSTPAYTLYHASIGTKIKWHNHDITLSVNVHNITNVAYYDHLSRFKPLGIYNMGRNITLSVHIPLTEIHHD